MAAHPDWLLRVTRASDVSRAHQEDKVGILLSLQRSDHFRSPDDVAAFHALGQRISQLTYNYANRIGSGFLERRDGGLTELGAEIVARMNQVGMAVDASHCGDRTTLDAIEVSERPVIVTHAAARGVVPGHLRAKTDEAIRALAARGGVMGIPFLRFLVAPEGAVTVEHVLDHFDHVATLVGVEHVAVGSDLDLPGNPNPVGREDAAPRPTANWERYRFHTDEDGRLTVPGLDHPKRVFDLTEGLIGRGYSDEAIRLVLGGNAVRALAAAWGEV